MPATPSSKSQALQRAGLWNPRARRGRDGQRTVGHGMIKHAHKSPCHFMLEYMHVLNSTFMGVIPTGQRLQVPASPVAGRAAGARAVDGGSPRAGIRRREAPAPQHAHTVSTASTNTHGYLHTHRVLCSSSSSCPLTMARRGAAWGGECR